jgi:hypothetical protein
MTRFELQVIVGLYLVAAYSRVCFGFVSGHGTFQTSQRRQGLVVINELQSFASESPSKQQQFLVHKGRSAAMIRRSPSLCGVTLYKGWTEQATQAFCDAVHSVGK